MNTDSARNVARAQLDLEAAVARYLRHPTKTGAAQIEAAELALALAAG